MLYTVLNYCVCYVFHTGELNIRQVVLLTSEIGNKWYKLGIALDIPLTTMEEFYGKYSENPMKALNRVYGYWLKNKNRLDPTWESLISALQEINEYSVATNVMQYRRPRVSLILIHAYYIAMFTIKMPSNFLYFIM